MHASAAAFKMGHPLADVVVLECELSGALELPQDAALRKQRAAK